MPCANADTATAARAAASGSAGIRAWVCAFAVAIIAAFATVVFVSPRASFVLPVDVGDCCRDDDVLCRRVFGRADFGRKSMFEKKWALMSTNERTPSCRLEV